MSRQVRVDNYLYKEAKKRQTQDNDRGMSRPLIDYVLEVKAEEERERMMGLFQPPRMLEPQKKSHREQYDPMEGFFHFP